MIGRITPCFISTDHLRTQFPSGHRHRNKQNTHKTQSDFNFHVVPANFRQFISEIRLKTYSFLLITVGSGKKLHSSLRLSTGLEKW
ncbi:hypothetical protein QVD17_36747 [Tagetes erecta]|uniref:Uncharacterized protein n=1 Tax=Tagetes erecta TaxID=13708 RepID=A0AAD8JTA0_TARER|nr:hypothetical protein QVD17_36747 [Tagetes erecta]